MEVRRDHPVLPARAPAAGRAARKLALLLAFAVIYLVWGSTYLAIRYAVSTLAFDWMIRLDDDTFMAPERLPGLIYSSTSQYIGSDRCYVPMYATGGAGVILSRPLAEHVAAQPTPASCPENPDQDDGWIGLVVRNAGHKLFWTPRLHHERAMRPGLQNDLVTAHWVLPSEMRDVYAKFYGERATGGPHH